MPDPNPSGENTPEWMRAESSPIMPPVDAPEADPDEVPCPDCGRKNWNINDEGYWECQTDGCDVRFHPTSIEK